MSPYAKVRNSIMYQNGGFLKIEQLLRFGNSLNSQAFNAGTLHCTGLQFKCWYYMAPAFNSSADFVPLFNAILELHRHKTLYPSQLHGNIIVIVIYSYRQCLPCCGAIYYTLISFGSINKFPVVPRELQFSFPGTQYREQRLSKDLSATTTTKSILNSTVTILGIRYL